MKQRKPASGTTNEQAERARKAMYKRGKKKSGDNTLSYYLVIGGFCLCMIVVIAYMILNPKQSLLTKQVIDHDEFLVHNSQNQFFTMGANDQFEGFTMQEASRLFNMGITDNPQMPMCKAKEDIAIPDEYDFRTDPQRKNCVDSQVRKTGNCTASHVLSVVSTIEDRICLLSDSEGRFRLSAQDALACDKTNYQCNGGYAVNTLNYAQRYGLVKEECAPWEATSNATCPDEPNPCREKGEDYKLISYCIAQGPDNIKREIMENGPVIAPMTPFTDFMTYKDGTYFPSEGAFKLNGQHIVKIVGWEKSVQGDTWIIENSWGEQWGMDGYAHVKAGHQDIGLDYVGIAPMPLSKPSSTYDNLSQEIKDEMDKTEGETEEI